MKKNSIWVFSWLKTIYHSCWEFTCSIYVCQNVLHSYAPGTKLSYYCYGVTSIMHAKLLGPLSGALIPTKTFMIGSTTQFSKLMPRPMTLRFAYVILQLSCCVTHYYIIYHMFNCHSLIDYFAYRGSGSHMIFHLLVEAGRACLIFCYCELRKQKY